MRVQRILLCLLIAGLLVNLAGCSKVTKSNFDKIKAGMTEAEVKGILGDPISESNPGGGMNFAIWIDGATFITVVFDGYGKVDAEMPPSYRDRATDAELEGD